LAAGAARVGAGPLDNLCDHLVLVKGGAGQVQVVMGAVPLLGHGVVAGVKELAVLGPLEEGEGGDMVGEHGWCSGRSRLGPVGRMTAVGNRPAHAEDQRCMRHTHRWGQHTAAGWNAGKAGYTNGYLRRPRRPSPHLCLQPPQEKALLACGPHGGAIRAVARFPEAEPAADLQTWDQYSAVSCLIQPLRACRAAYMGSCTDYVHVTCPAAAAEARRAPLPCV
jgi:hypothetical protein